jgi:hypothetical protein
MRKAILVLATSVAFLLFVVPNSYAGIKKKVQLPTAQTVASGSGVPVKSGNSLSIPGQLQQEYIPADNFSRTVPLKVLPTIDYSIPRTINAVKGILKNNAASIAVGGVISGLVLGLDWVMDEGSGAIKKTSAPVYVDPSTGTGWCVTQNNNSICNEYYGNHSTPSSAALAIDALCLANAQYCAFKNQVPIPATKVNDATYHYSGHFTIRRQGTCPGWDSSGGCPSGPATTVPITDSDLSLVDAYVSAQSSQWLKDIIRESCSGSLSPASCFDDLKDNVSLSGPSTVNGPSTITTTTGPGGVTTKETKTTFGITYGSDYFIYAPITTTTTVNPDGTTEVETEEPAEEEESPEEDIDATIGDPYAPVVAKYNDIAGGVGDLEGNMSFINYGPWYSFGGACSPITLNLPVMGSYTIDYCPYVIDWIRPTLGFLFAVWTWLHCFALWRETLQNARPI